MTALAPPYLLSFRRSRFGMSRNAPQRNFLCGEQKPAAKETTGAFHSTKNSEILNGTVKIPGKVFENLGICLECTLFVGISGIIEFARDVGFSLLWATVSLSTERRRSYDTVQLPVCHSPKKQQHLFFWQNCGPPR